MTSEPQRCAAWVATGRKHVTGSDVKWPCNLPIEGSGPCALCGRQPKAGTQRHSGADTDADLLAGRFPCRYQPSQWRHADPLSEFIEPGHEATPVRETA